MTGYIVRAVSMVNYTIHAENPDAAAAAFEYGPDRPHGTITDTWVDKVFLEADLGEGWIKQSYTSLMADDLRTDVTKPESRSTQISSQEFNRAAEAFYEAEVGEGLNEQGERRVRLHAALASLGLDVPNPL